MFQDLIEILLQKKATADAEKEREVAEALVRIDEKYADRLDKIDRMLNECGYEEPIEAPMAEEVAEPVAEEAPIAEPATEQFPDEVFVNHEVMA